MAERLSGMALDETTTKKITRNQSVYPQPWVRLDFPDFYLESLSPPTLQREGRGGKKVIRFQDWGSDCAAACLSP